MLQHFFIKLQAYLAIKAKCNEADAMYHKDGQRRFVIPFNDGTLETLTKDEALTLKHVGYLPTDFTAKTIYGASFYWSATNDTTAKSQGAMPKKEAARRRKAFYRWFYRHHSTNTINPAV